MSTPRRHTGTHYELELDALADELMRNPDLRAEVTERVIRSLGKPTDLYIKWKGRVNRLAKDLRVRPSQQLEAVIRRAMEMVA